MLLISLPNFYIDDCYIDVKAGFSYCCVGMWHMCEVSVSQDEILIYDLVDVVMLYFAMVVCEFCD